jgi:hypothetical protein
MTPHVVIMLLTYGRLDYAIRTLESTLSNVRTSHALSVHIASDGDGDDYIRELLSLAHQFPDVVLVGTSNSQRAGYGANYNLATQVVHGYASHVLPLEDDWELTRELDLDVHIGALDELQAGCMRLGYLGYTQPLRGEFASSHGRHWLRLDPSSAEPHVFAGHPRLETVAWERTVGPWPEGLEPGQTEFAVAHIAESRHGVIWPVQEVKPYGDLFVHFGAVRSW